jgi:hypothetical protein
VENRKGLAMGRTRRWVAIAAASLAVAGTVPVAGAAELIAVELDRCAICMRFDATVARTYAHTPQGRAAPLRRVNADQSSNFAGVSMVPTFILRAKGREVGRIIGYRDPASFYRNVDTLLAAAR